MLTRLPRTHRALPSLLARALASPYGSEGKIDAGADDVAELLEGVLDSSPRSKREDERPRVVTLRREALSLYREVLRSSNLFTWTDERGRLWRDLIRESARKEFEAAREERDPELLQRMLITGRDAVRKAVERFADKHIALQQQQQQQQQEQQQGRPLQRGPSLF